MKRIAAVALSGSLAASAHGLASAKGARWLPRIAKFDLANYRMP
ncbi:hypothetical protein [Frateuria defendens]|nr:hypothetical protein [Frateuria defendens]